jgi:hypothetical protein
MHDRKTERQLQGLSSRLCSAQLFHSFSSELVLAQNPLRKRSALRPSLPPKGEQ